jgi:hypothetical protein
VASGFAFGVRRGADDVMNTTLQNLQYVACCISDEMSMAIEFMS